MAFQLKSLHRFESNGNDSVGSENWNFGAHPNAGGGSTLPPDYEPARFNLGVQNYATDHVLFNRDMLYNIFTTNAQGALGFWFTIPSSVTLASNMRLFNYKADGGDAFLDVRISPYNTSAIAVNFSGILNSEIWVGTIPRDTPLWFAIYWKLSKFQYRTSLDRTVVTEVYDGNELLNWTSTGGSPSLQTWGNGASPQGGYCTFGCDAWDLDDYSDFIFDNLTTWTWDNYSDLVSIQNHRGVELYDAGVTPTLEISNIPLSNPEKKHAYSEALIAVDGASPYAYDLLEGDTPTGLSLGATGLVSGTPTKLERTEALAKVTDNNGEALVFDLDLDVISAGPYRTQFDWNIERVTDEALDTPVALDNVRIVPANLDLMAFLVSAKEVWNDFYVRFFHAKQGQTIWNLLGDVRIPTGTDVIRYITDRFSPPYTPGEPTFDPLREIGPGDLIRVMALGSYPAYDISTSTNDAAIRWNIRTRYSQSFTTPGQQVYLDRILVDLRTTSPEFVGQIWVKVLNFSGGAPVNYSEIAQGNEIHVQPQDSFSYVQYESIFRQNDGTPGILLEANTEYALVLQVESNTGFDISLRWDNTNPYGSGKAQWSQTPYSGGWYDLGGDIKMEIWLRNSDGTMVDAGQKINVGLLCQSEEKHIPVAWSWDNVGPESSVDGLIHDSWRSIAAEYNLAGVTWGAVKTGVEICKQRVLYLLPWEESPRTLIDLEYDPNRDTYVNSIRTGFPQLTFPEGTRFGVIDITDEDAIVQKSGVMLWFGDTIDDLGIPDSPDPVIVDETLPERLIGLGWRWNQAGVAGLYGTPFAPPSDFLDGFRSFPFDAEIDRLTVSFKSSDSILSTLDYYSVAFNNGSRHFSALVNQIGHRLDVASPFEIHEMTVNAEGVSGTTDVILKVYQLENGMPVGAPVITSDAFQPFAPDDSTITFSGNKTVPAGDIGFIFECAAPYDVRLKQFDSPSFDPGPGNVIYWDGTSWVEDPVANLQMTIVAKGNNVGIEIMHGTHEESLDTPFVQLQLPFSTDNYRIALKSGFPFENNIIPANTVFGMRNMFGSGIVKDLEATLWVKPHGNLVAYEWKARNVGKTSGYYFIVPDFLDSIRAVPHDMDILGASVLVERSEFDTSGLEIVYAPDGFDIESGSQLVAIDIAPGLSNANLWLDANDFSLETLTSGTNLGLRNQQIDLNGYAYNVSVILWCSIP